MYNRFTVYVSFHKEYVVVSVDRWEGAIRSYSHVSPASVTRILRLSTYLDADYRIRYNPY